MKFTKILSLFLVLTVSIFNINAQAVKKKAAKAVKVSAAVYKIDAAQSSVAWLAKKVTGQHNGTVNISGGSVTTLGSAIKGGEVIVDMKSIKIVDLQGEYAGKLAGHLSSDDFFSVEKNPITTFKITKVEGGNVTGDLTIKGITNSITVPMAVAISGNNLSATGKIDVDRTKYDIKYGSKSFFTSIGDKAIDDTFALTLNIVATK